MSDYLNCLVKKLSNNEVSRIYLDRVLTEVGDSGTAMLNHIISDALSHYRAFLISSNQEGGGETAPKHLDRVIELFPTFLLRVLSYRREYPRHASVFDSLLVIFSAYLLILPVNKASHVSLILNDIRGGESLKELNAKLIRKSETDLFAPKFVYLDVLSIGKAGFGPPSSENQQELLEHLFCVEGLRQFFTLFYLALLNGAKTDIVSAHFHILFQPLFASLAMFKNEFFCENPGIGVEINKFLKTDSSASEGASESCVTEFIQDRLFLYNVDLLSNTDREIIRTNSQFNDFLGKISQLSSMGLMIFLQAVLNLLGRVNIEMILTQIKDTEPKKLEVFQRFMSTQTKGAYKQLAEVVLESKMRPAKPVPDDGVKSNQAKKQDAAKLTLSEIQDYLWLQLSRLLDQLTNVERSNVTIHKVLSKYLHLTSKSAAEIISDVVEDKDDIDVFVKLLEPLITDMAKRQTLSISDINILKNDVDRQAEQHQRNIIEIKGLLDESEIVINPDSMPESEPILMEEIIPIGLEEGAPKITALDFFQFPLGSHADEPGEAARFEQHISYLEIAVDRTVFLNEDLEELKLVINQIPVANYQKWYNIFPYDQFDETKLLVVFSLWRNGQLERLKI